MASIRETIVFIYLSGEAVAVPAGIFTHDGDTKTGSFVYGRRYLERPNVLPVDPVALPLGHRSIDVAINGGLYGAFRDATPDYWGRLVMAAEAGVPTEALSEMDFLMSGNATRSGNLDFRPSPDTPEPSLAPPSFHHLADLLRAAAMVEAREPVDARLLHLLRQGTSMGGARPKCTVAWEENLWIAKFTARGDTVSVPRIEFATMTLAGECGLRIPEVHCVRPAESDVFLTQRFDREPLSGGRFARRGYLSALSFAQWDEGDRLLWSYLSLADRMRSLSPVADLTELFGRMVFNVLVRNTDDHPRNHAFLLDGDMLSLSPAFDLMPTLVRPGVGSAFSLAMTCGPRGRDGSIENILGAAARFGLSAEKAQETVTRIRETVAGWRNHFEECGVSASEIDALTPSFGT